jgi:hypothetical protein
MTADVKLAPLMVADLVLGHNQTKEVDNKLGSTRFNKEKEFAKPIISKFLRNQRDIFFGGDAGKRPCLMSSKKKA